MKDAEIRFELENQAQTYYAGQDVRGNVHVIVHKTIKPRKIKVEFTGKVHASFSQGSGDNRRHYSATNKFLEEQFNIWEPNQRGAGDSIAPGDYRFPFCIKLHPNREYPPVFTGAHGYIRYELEANIDLAWQVDPTAEIHPVIVGLYNASDPKYQVPVEDQDSKTICCCCCASPPITCKLTLPVGGALPGDPITPSIAVSNPSSKPVLAVKCLLKQKVDYRAQGGHETSSKEFELLHFPDNIAPGTNALTLCKQAMIPTDLVPSFASTIITISYKIVAVLVMPSFVLNLDTSVPFFIGNSRVVQNSDGIGPQLSSPQQPGYPPQQPGYPPQQPGYPPQQPGYPPQQPGYPPQQPGYPPQDYAYAQQPGYPPQQPGYPPQQPGYPPQDYAYAQQPGYPPQQPGYPPQQPGYPPQDYAYAQQPGHPQ